MLIIYYILFGNKLKFKWRYIQILICLCGFYLWFQCYNINGFSFGGLLGVCCCTPCYIGYKLVYPCN